MAAIRFGNGGPSGMNDGTDSAGLFDLSQPAGWTMIFWIASIALLALLYFSL